MNSNVSCSIRLDSPQLIHVAEMVDHLIVFLRDQSVQDSRFLDEFRLAATEAMNNAIEHGSVNIADPIVKVEMTLSEDEVRLEVSDRSDFAGWEGEVSLPEDPFAEGGRGRFLIEQLTTSVESGRRDGLYVLTLHKALGKAGWRWDPGAQERVLDAMTEEVGANYEVINALIGLGELLAGAGEMASFLTQALERVCQLTGADAAYVRMARPAGLALRGTVGTFGRELDAIVPLTSVGVEAQVFSTGEEMTVVSSGSLDLMDPLCGHLQAAFVAPIFFKSERRGVLVLVQNDAGRSYFSALQLQVARVVGEYLGIVYAMSELQSRKESERRALQELEIAAEIQMSLMPQRFELSDRFDICGRCLPALQAGGDYFDLIALPGGGIFVVMADVMGKGISAALLANMLRTHLRAKLDLASDPGAMLTAVNRAMAPDLAKLEMFITVACAWIPPDGGEIREASAGHPAALLYSGTEHSEVMESQGLPVGVLADTEYETGRFSMEVGDALVLFTDGIPEASDEAGAFFDVVGIEREMAKRPPDSAEEIIDRVLGSVNAFSEHAPPSDDRTMLAIIRKR